MCSLRSKKIDIKKRLTAVLTVAVFVFSTAFVPLDAFAETGNSSSGTGYIDDTETDDYLTVESSAPTVKKKALKSQATSLPSTFDSRSQTYYKGHVKVLDQGSTNTCWAYAVTTTAHISYLKERYDSGLSVSGDYTPAPRHFAYFFFNRQKYPYGYNGYDKNLVLSGYNYLNNGGNNYCAAVAMADWVGLCKQSQKNLLSKSNAYKNFITLENAKFLNNIVRKVTISYQDQDDETVTVSKSANVLNVATVKNAIQKYGAVTVQMYYDDRYYNAAGKGYYCDYSFETLNDFGAANHAVTIVGWDDNFSRENFTSYEDVFGGSVGSQAVDEETEPSAAVSEPSSESESSADSEPSSESDPSAASKPAANSEPAAAESGEGSDEADLQPLKDAGDAGIKAEGVQDEGTAEATDTEDELLIPNPEKSVVQAQTSATAADETFDGRPVNDGAWIVQNSHGVDKTGRTNSGGYMYVSYEDMGLSGAIALDMQPASAYNANFQHDGTGYASTTVGKGIKTMPVGGEVANMFSVPVDGKKHTLRSVGFMTWNLGKSKYNVKVYKNAKTKPNTGTLMANFNVTTDAPGYYTFDLKKYGATPAEVKSGTKFSVIVKGVSLSGADKKFSYAMEGSYRTNVGTFLSQGAKGLCFYRNTSGAAWSDLYNSNGSANFRIKAMTTTVNKPRITASSLKIPAAAYHYTGKAVVPNPTVKVNGKTLKKGTDYTVTYSKNKMPGVAKITIKAKPAGAYYGSATKSFTIGAVKIFRATSIGKKSVKLKWSKAPNMTGYKIYRYKSGKWKCVKTIKKNKKVSFKNKKLKRHKTYKYKIRAYKKIGKKKYYGPYSPVITIKTK